MGWRDEDVSWLSISRLAWITRKKPGTVASKLREAGLPTRSDGRAERYDPRDALPILFGVGEGLNPAAEKARADRAQAELRELELEVRRERLVPREDQQGALAALAFAFVTRLEALEAPLAQEVSVESDPATCQALIRAAHHRLRESIAATGDGLAAGGVLVGDGPEPGPEEPRRSRRRTRERSAAA